MWNPARFWWLPEACSPLAFLRELPVVKQERNPWAGQVPVDVGREAVLKLPPRAEFGSDGDWVTAEHKDQVASC